MLTSSETQSLTPRVRRLVMATGLLFIMLPLSGWAQPPTDPGGESGGPVAADTSEDVRPDNGAAAENTPAGAADAAGAGADADAGGAPADSAVAVAGSSSSTMPSLWDLAIQGGWFMIPIGIASIITISFTLERLVGLRRGRILPRKLIRRVRELMTDQTLDPRKLWEAAEQRRSPLANVMKAAILKTGRPHAEVEKAVEDAVQRETGLMMRNLRPINVVASIAPLLGLLGTVQGMILAFMVTSTTTSTGTAKAQELAHGIYTALVTTFAGLTVAVVSVILANFLEGRVERMLHYMEAIFLDLLPGLERYEGRVRIAESATDGEGIRIKQLAPAERAMHQRMAQTDGGAKARVSTAGQSPRAVKTAKSVRRPEHPLTADEVGSTATDVQTAARSLRSHFDG